MKIDKKKLLCGMINADMNNNSLSKESGISVNQISNIRQGRGTTYETASKIARVLGMNVMDLIDETEIQKWIPLSEHEPEEKGEYIVTFDDGDVTVLWYTGNDWDYCLYTADVIAWMPLPEPYDETK